MKAISKSQAPSPISKAGRPGGRFLLEIENWPTWRVAMFMQKSNIYLPRPPLPQLFPASGDRRGMRQYRLGTRASEGSIEKCKCSVMRRKVGPQIFHESRGILQITALSFDSRASQSRHGHSHAWHVGKRDWADGTTNSSSHRISQPLRCQLDG